MNQPSEKQIGFIRSLVNERRQTLTDLKPEWLTTPTTTREASDIISRLMALPRDPKAPTAEDADLATDMAILKNGLGELSGRDFHFASSLVKQYEERGTLSDRQRAFIPKLFKAMDGADKPVPMGIHRASDGTIVLVYLTKNGRQAGKVLDEGTFIYASGVIARFNLSDETVISQAQAQEFGRTHGFCVACAKPLTDDRSLASGYGAVCAGKYGWHYCTREEAVAILGRPVACQHQWELVKTDTNYYSPQLGTGSWTEHYECANCDECKTVNIVNNRSGD
jgi:hypothetical protein